MNVYVALLRGINIGGKHLLPMKELAALLESCGAQQVKTYIQSGNAVFRSAESDPARLARQVTDAITARYGFAPCILVLAPAAIAQAMANNPFPEAEDEPTSLHVGFLAAPPASPDLEKLARLRAGNERFRVIGSVFYLHAPEGVGKSRLAKEAEGALGVPMTARNWRTVCKIQEMADG